MEEISIRTLLSSLKMTVNDIQFTHYQKRVAFEKGKKGDCQRHKLRIGYLQRKLKGLMDKLNRKLNGIIITVTYRVGDKTYEQTFTNLTRQEVVDILQIRAIMENASVEILEIKEIPTQIREV